MGHKYANVNSKHSEQGHLSVYSCETSKQRKSLLLSTINITVNYDSDNIISEIEWLTNWIKNICNKWLILLWHTGGKLWIWHKPLGCCWCNGMRKIISWPSIESLGTCWALFASICLHSRVTCCCWPDASLKQPQSHFFSSNRCDFGPP